MKKRNKSKVRGGNPARQRSRPMALAHSASPSIVPSAALPRTARRVSAAIAAPAFGYSQEDRRSLALLLAPFLIVAASLAGQQTLRSWPTPAGNPIVVTRAPAPIAAAPVAPPSPIAVAPPAAVSVPTTKERVAIRRAPLPALAPIIAEPKARPLPEEPRVAALDPASRPAPKSPARPAPENAAPLPPIALPPTVAVPRAPEVCVASPALFERQGAARPIEPGLAADPARFGLALAAAARGQLDSLVIYNARYQRIGYPMGDVAPLYGVCTDVIVRAYRALGIDLQELIVTTKSGRGDAHIDHRRVEVVRRFFEKHGEKLPITDFPEDYQPGDVVTFYRPQNRISTAHIAIVTDRLAPSGRLMIVHNRGWGPQLEDALFVDKITGHYRYRGAPVAAVQVARSSAPAAQAERSPPAGLTLATYRVPQSRATKPPAQ